MTRSRSTACGSTAARWHDVDDDIAGGRVGRAASGRALRIVARRVESGRRAGSVRRRARSCKRDRDDRSLDMRSKSAADDTCYVLGMRRSIAVVVCAACSGSTAPTTTAPASPAIDDAFPLARLDDRALCDRLLARRPEDTGVIVDREPTTRR